MSLAPLLVAVPLFAALVCGIRGTRAAGVSAVAATTTLVVGLVVVDGAAGSIILACGFIALFGAGIKLISRNDPTPPDGVDALGRDQVERRLPAGHSGM